MQEVTNPIRATSAAGIIRFNDAVTLADLKLDFTNNIALISRFKIVSTTHDISTDGSQAITGAGFAPKAAVVLAVISGTVAASWGLTDGTNKATIYTNESGTADNFGVSAANILIVATGAGAYSVVTLTSMDADGMTINWTKTGLPTGTVTIYILFFR